MFRFRFRMEFVDENVPGYDPCVLKFVSYSRPVSHCKYK